RVTNCVNGLSSIGSTEDKGPWNENDPYWLKGARPAAESGTDTRNRKANGAGIDISPALAKAIKLDGKGKVDLEFVVDDKATTTSTPETPAPGVVARSWGWLKSLWR